MSDNCVVLLLGTNLGDKNGNLLKVIGYINKEVGKVIKEGKVTETKPVEFTSDSNFLNQLISIETEFSPFDVLYKVKEIEKKMGRVYSQPRPREKYVSRIIDIDILYYNQLKIKSNKLQIPHSQVKKRVHVIEMLIQFSKDTLP